MKYMLDTNICIYVINEQPQKVLDKFTVVPCVEVCISSITHAELQYGIEGSVRKQQNQAALDEFLLPLTILPFHGMPTMKHYGEIRCYLESRGESIGPFDTQIAAHARSLSLTLVSNNLKEFSRVPGLRCENWA